MTRANKRKLRLISKKLRLAHSEVMRYCFQTIKPREGVQLLDFWEFSLAIDKEKLLEVEYSLLESKIYPDLFNYKQRNYLVCLKSILKKRMRCWTIKKLPPKQLVC